jgi:L-aspartate oxidase
VAVLEHVTVSDGLLDEAGQAAGVDLLTAHGEQQRVPARAVVLATGGVGQVYATTSNPQCATGDGLALALRAGARVQDAEFVQFHPTALWLPTGPVEGHQPLITEALRGAGAILRDDRGRRLMSGVHPQADLAPRDVVSAAIHATMRARGIDHVFLDATGIDRATLEHSFPSVLAACRTAGVDPGRDPIPVAPAAHYHCGGVRAGLDGRTDVVGLHAIGEVARTGMHGANRLASNSLTEALLTGFRAGESLARDLPVRRGSVHRAPAPASVGPETVPALRRAMDERAGVLRDAEGLDELLAELARTPGEDPPARTPAQVEATNLHLVGQLVATAARTRAESRGCHRRSDAPTSQQRWETTVSLTWEDGALRAIVDAHGAAA